MLFLVNDILDFAQLEENKIVLNTNQEVKLEATVNDCLEVLRFKSDSKKLKLFSQVGESLQRRGGAILTDGNRLKQILINLISNAIKYTQQGSVRVQLEYNPYVNMVDIAVIDSGVGIEADKLEGLFSAFTKIMRFRELNNEGVGLGLTISKNLAVALGGDVTVKSSLGVGTTFTISLPYKEPPKKKLLRNATTNSLLLLPPENKGRKNSMVKAPVTEGPADNFYNGPALTIDNNMRSMKIPEDEAFNSSFEVDDQSLNSKHGDYMTAINQIKFSKGNDRDAVTLSQVQINTPAINLRASGKDNPLYLGPNLGETVMERIVSF